MSAKTRLILITAAAVTFYSLLTWFLISSNSRRGHNGYLIFFIILILFVAPIYPLVVKGLRKRPLLFALGILLVVASGACGFAGITGGVVLHLAAGWVDVAADLSMGLAVASCMLFIWNAFVQRNKQ